MSPYNLRRKLIFLVLVRLLHLVKTEVIPDEHLVLPSPFMLKPTFYRNFKRGSGNRKLLT